ncbi:hypothetical protein BCF74_10712 [Knoellia remsis]|uniref:Uncharacterized protein n=1 Tax=Knoellia remsis TaxID=407159 RepID=A0A2T0UQP3_9MICO|nr:hypothetical protein [Knoellia remsis]PRY60226.1 hypothetical protein BCF74_10712 [Knoellia remsis]
MPDHDHDHDLDDIHDLLVRAPMPDLHYDLAQTLRAGRRVRMRRRLAAGGAGLAALAAVAVGFTALGGLPERETRPAGTGPTVGVSAPVSAELLDYRYAVELRPGPDGAGPTVVSYSVEGGKRTELSRWTAPTDEKVSLRPSPDGTVLLGIAPAWARTFTLVTADGAPASAGAQQARPLDGTDFQAVGFRLGGGVKADALDVIWSDDDGAYDAKGDALPSTLDAATGTRLILDPTRRLILSERLDGRERSISTYPAGSTPWNADGLDQRATSVQVSAATFALPTKGQTPRNVVVRWSTGETGPAVIVGAPGEWTFVAGVRERPDTPPKGQVFPTAVEWTDSSGTRRSEPVKAPTN